MPAWLELLLHRHCVVPLLRECFVAYSSPSPRGATGLGRPETASITCPLSAQVAPLLQTMRSSQRYTAEDSLPERDEAMMVQGISRWVSLHGWTGEGPSEISFLSHVTKSGIYLNLLYNGAVIPVICLTRGIGCHRPAQLHYFKSKHDWSYFCDFRQS